MMDSCDAVKMPRVSVIMPVYNAGEYVGEAIASVRAQTMLDWELLIIDDCSTDDTPDHIRLVARDDERIHILQNEKNSGVARTRNRGIELAKGEYIAFLDSDDVWHPRFLERMLIRQKETGADIVYCSYAIVGEKGQKVCNDFIVPASTDFKSSIIRNVISCSTVLIKREMISNKRFPTDIYHEDIALWFELLRDGAVACGVTEILASYRQHEGSRSSSKLASAYRRWPIYRQHLGFSVMESAVYMAKYAYYGFKKYKTV